MISATALGYIGRDATTEAAGQSTVTSFSLGCQRKRRDGQRETTWLKVQLWGRRGESLCPYLTKGTRLLVTGQLRQFEDRDGERHLELNADQLELLGGSDRPRNGQGREPAQQQPRPVAQPGPEPAPEQVQRDFGDIDAGGYL